MVASRATAAGMPCFRASAAVCAPIQAPTMREKSASSPTEATNPLTVEALVKVTIPAACGEATRCAACAGRPACPPTA